MGLQERMQIIGLMIKQNGMSNSPEKKKKADPTFNNDCKTIPEYTSLMNLLETCPAFQPN
jgi:hypothetical protein